VGIILGEGRERTLRRIANVGKWKRGFMAIDADVTMGGGG